VTDGRLAGPEQDGQLPLGKTRTMADLSSQPAPVDARPSFSNHVYPFLLLPAHQGLALAGVHVDFRVDRSIQEPFQVGDKFSRDSGELSVSHFLRVLEGPFLDVGFVE